MQMEEQMTVKSELVEQIESFVGGWTEGGLAMKERFLGFYKLLTDMDGVSLTFTARPGVSYSLRPKADSQQDRELFAMVDVIDDDPTSRWLSVCFYGDLITDPEEKGELIPGGLAGDDGYCFDMFEDEPELAAYLVVRLKEAAANCSAG